MSSSFPPDRPDGKPRGGGRNGVEPGLPVSRETATPTPDAVPRETAPPAPAAAAIVFADRLPLARRYASLLAAAGVERGLLGPREVPRLWERHLLNCAVVAPALPAGVTVLDVGSGAGLPGLVLAVCRPDVQIVLCEPLLRRSQFLSEALAELGLGNARVLRARVEELSAGPPWQLVTARAVAPLARLAAWTLPLLAPGGRLLALKGASAERELAAARVDLARLGARRWDIVEFGSGVLFPPTRVVEIEAGAPVRQAKSSTRRRDGRRQR